MQDIQFNLNLKKKMNNLIFSKYVPCNWGQNYTKKIFVTYLKFKFNSATLYFFQ